MKEALFIFGTTAMGMPEFSADLLWATKGYSVPDPVVFLEIGGKKILLASPLEVDRAAKEAAVDEVVLAEPREKSKSGSFLVDFLKSRGVTRLVVPEYIRYSLVQKLTEHFEIQVRGDPFYPERAVKNEQEIAEIEKSQRAAESATGAAMEFLMAAEIREGKICRNGGTEPVTSHHLRRVIDDELYRQGCLGVETIVSSGVEAADPHSKGYGELRPGEPLVLDIFPRSLSSLYFADQTRTVFKGAPSPQMARMYETVLKAQKTAIEMIKPGMDGQEIDAAARRVLDEAGYPTITHERPMRGFIHSLGHGVGLEIHESPSLSTRHETLKTGHVVTVEPGLYYPAAIGEIPAGGIRIEDMVVVTEDGFRNLTKFPKELHDIVID